MACQVFYRGQDGTTGDTIVFRSNEADLELVSGGRKWSFEGDGELFRLVSEAERIRLAYLFDPYVAVSSSTIDPLPHQISAVYEHMLPRQPMRFLLADDPGAGKTIMAGLLIKELLIRGELERCLIVAPGSLTEQWQDDWPVPHSPSIARWNGGGSGWKAGSRKNACCWRAARRAASFCSMPSTSRTPSATTTSPSSTRRTPPSRWKPQRRHSPITPPQPRPLKSWRSRSKPSRAWSG